MAFSSENDLSVLKELQFYENNTGAKINQGKTMGLKLGNFRKFDLKNICDIKWMEEDVLNMYQEQKRQLINDERLDHYPETL